MNKTLYEIVEEKYANTHYTLRSMAKERGVGEQRMRQIIRAWRIYPDFQMGMLNLYRCGDCTAMLESKQGSPTLGAAGRPVKWTNGKAVERAAAQLFPLMPYGQGIKACLEKIGQAADNSWLAKPISLAEAQELFAKAGLTYDQRRHKLTAV
jgi:hypothetical protein